MMMGLCLDTIYANNIQYIKNDTTNRHTNGPEKYAPSRYFLIT